MRGFMLLVALATPMVASRSGGVSRVSKTSNAVHLTTKPHTFAPVTTAKVAVRHNGSATKTSTKSVPMHAGNQPKISTLIFER